MGGRGRECVVRCSAVEWSRGEGKREEKRREGSIKRVSKNRYHSQVMTLTLISFIPL